MSREERLEHLLNDALRLLDLWEDGFPSSEPSGYSERRALLQMEADALKTLRAIEKGITT